MKTFAALTVAFAFFFSITGCQKDPVETNFEPRDSNIVPILRVLSFAPSIARVGDTVNITGTAFGKILSQVTVKVGTVQSPIVALTDSTMRIVIAANSQTGLISVTVASAVALSVTELTIDNSVIVPWTEKSVFPATLTNGLGYIPAVGLSAGTKGFFYKSNKLWEFIPSTNAWVEKASRPAIGNAGVSYSTGFVIDNHIYIALTDAFDGADSVQLWAYSITANSWERKKAFPGVNRIAPFSFALNGNGYVGGGQRATAGWTNYQDVWKYDPATNSWSPVADYPGTVTLGISGFNIGTYGYVFDAGPGNPRAPTSGSGSQGKLYRYADATNTWQQMATLPAPSNIVSASCFSVTGKAYAVLTMPATAQNATTKRNFWEYNEASNTWIERTDAGGALRWFGSGFAISNKAYVGLGTGNTFNSYKLDFWEYDREP